MRMGYESPVTKPGLSWALDGREPQSVPVSKEDFTPNPRERYNRFVSFPVFFAMIDTGTQAKTFAALYCQHINVSFDFGLAEQDRYGEWKVPLLSRGNTVGNVYVTGDGGINLERTTKLGVILERMGNVVEKGPKSRSKGQMRISPLPQGTVICDDALLALDEIPEKAIDLIFTSPPYYNAKPEYQEYATYEEYLRFIREIVHKCHRILDDGRFFVINISHVLVPRSNRNESSTRLAVPFDFHRIFIEQGFEFIDDIIWQKPAGAGWASSRGRRFAADRNPLQYKAVPVTEYVLVYRKKSDRLIDWFIRNHPNQEHVTQSKVPDGYEATNVWYICPSHSKVHPATFPVELAEKVISYYSFVNDVVLDPFAGIGTVGTACINKSRRYYLIEREPKYIETFSGYTRLNNERDADATANEDTP